MITNDQKLKRFSGEAISAANEIAANIRAEVDENKKNILAERERKIKDESKAFVDEELKKIRRANTIAVSSKTTELKTMLLKQREGILDEIMAEVTGKVCEFVKHEEIYGGFLENLCLNILTNFNESCEIFLSPGDVKKYKNRILNKLNEKYLSQNGGSVSCTILSDETILIGGAKFHLSKGAVFINETLDENLERQRERFTLMMMAAMREMSGQTKL